MFPQESFMHSNYRPQRSQAKAIARKQEEERISRFRRLLAISIMSALTLSAVLLARAETWVTVNEDGSVTKTETRAQAQVSPDARAGNAADVMTAYDQAVTGTVTTPSAAYQAPNTTFFS